MNRNIVAEANAGTGKTTFGKKEIITRLIKNNLEPSKLLAVTFTEKMASELKNEIAKDIISISSGEMPAHLKELEDVENSKEIAKYIIRELRKGFIGTIHGFCSLVILRYPNLCRVPPNLKVVETNEELESIFNQEFSLWLKETKKEPSNPLRIMVTKDVRELLWSIVRDFSIPDEYFSGPQKFSAKKTSPENMKSFIEREINNLISNAKPSADIKRLQLIEEWYPGSPENVDIWLDHIRRLSTTKEVVKQNGKLKDIYKLCATNDYLTNRFVQLAKQLVLKVRKKFVSSGFLSFDLMITIVLEALRNNFQLRKTLKRQFDLVFVDEFQDTDPFQFELIMYICEEEGSFAQDFKNIKLKPGKLLIAGDPKQSIYKFRNADLMAYKKVRDKILENGELKKLTDNYRSCENLVRISNFYADKMFNETTICEKTFNSIYTIDTEPSTAKAKESFTCSEQCLNVFLVKNDSENKTALSELIAKETAVQIRTLNDSGVNYGDIAILMRKLKNVYLYAEILNDAGIPFWISGGKAFYKQPETVDIYNILEVVAFPSDVAALISVLRGPLCWAPAGKLVNVVLPSDKNYGLPPHKWLTNRDDKQLEFCKPVLDFIGNLISHSATYTAAEVIEKVLQETPFISQILRLSRNELAIANIMKIYRMALESKVSLRQFARSLRDKIQSQEDYGEEDEPLAEGGHNAVRIMSIHKSKGLQFNQVILPEISTSIGKGRTDKNKIGIAWGDNDNHGNVSIGLQTKLFRDWTSIEIENNSEPDEFEEMRLLYVALTRAREKIYVIDSSTRNREGYLGEKLFEHINSVSKPLYIKAGDVEKEYEQIKKCKTTIGKIPAIKPSEDVTRDVETGPEFVTPSYMFQHSKGGAKKELGVEIGIVCHEVLSKVNFADPVYYDILDLSIEILSLESHYFLGELNELKKQCQILLEPFFKSDIAKMLSQKNIYRELPVCALIDGKIIDGRVDLAWFDANGCAVADYKTDNLDELELKRVYSDQINAYVKALESSTGKKTKGYIISLPLIKLIAI